MMCNSYDMCPDMPPMDTDKCKKDAKHYIDISVPVDVSPEAKVGKIDMECCGETKVVCDECKAHNVCKLTLIQKICVKIPITYSIRATTGEEEIQCCKDK